MCKEFIYMLDTYLSKSFLGTIEIYSKYYIAIIEDNIFKFFHVSAFKIRCKYVTLHSQNLIWFSGPIAQLVRVEDS